ncbi:MAG: peptide deformylase [Cyanobium sp.]
MTVREVLRLGDPRLRQRSAELAEDLFGSAELQALIADLRDTMAARDGAGLAAPQIGVPLRVVIYGITANPRYPEAPPIPETLLINPVLMPLGQERQSGWEGCLSVPGLRGRVQRARRLQVAWRDPDGRCREKTVEGFHARVVQHECDHLDGLLFVDRLEDSRAFGFTDALQAAGVL